MTFVSDLEPKTLWQHFDEILKIPRGSKHEDAARDYVIGVAKRNGLKYQQDSAGNLVVNKAGDKGRVTILQCHLDMVNEKNAEVLHDFSKDPIRPRKEGDYLCAQGTTLGSDNGIGVAASLALLEADELSLPPLECLFTIDEETGLTGAGRLGKDLLTGHLLINLDTEEENCLYVGCAGGAGLNISLPLQWTNPPTDSAAVKVELLGLKGGHSGVDIHLQRGNAIKLLARALRATAAEATFDLSDFSGGNMHNAIPREAFAKVSIPSDQRELFDNVVRTQFEAIRQEFRPAEPDMTFSVDATQVDRVLATDSRDRLIHLLDGLPHGVISMSYDIADLVETSSNPATVKIEDSTLRLHVSNRSSVATALDAIQRRVESIARLSGARVEWTDSYPGWKPDLDSKLLGVARRVHKEALGVEPEVKAVHAGLECGIIKEKYPHIDMVSLGPQIEFPHSPDERVHIGSVGNFYKLLTGLLAALAEEE